jgi:hypothetical protein
VTLETAANRAARMLKPRQADLARAVARQLQRTVPRYKDVEPVAMEKNITAILIALDPLLKRGSEATLRAVVNDVAQLRSAGGFGVDELVMAGLCFLPVLRRYLVSMHADPIEGLEAYEAVEAVTLPLIGHVAAYLQDASEATDPGAWSDISFPLFIEELEDDEVTVKNLRPAR